MKKANWKIKDIIDLEYFIQHDEKDEVDHASLSERDRRIYLEYIRPLESNGKTLNPAQSLRIWMEHRREMESTPEKDRAILPGALFNEIYILLKYGFLILGFMTGSGLAFSFLYYKGIEPLNVSAFLGIFVLVQTIMLIFLILISLTRSLIHRPLYSSMLIKSLARFLAKLILKAKEHGSRKLSGSMRGRLEAASGIFREKRRTYHSLFLWPFFILSQIFMTAFNIGIISALLLKIMGSDVAFGWQSTLKISADWVYRVVQSIATPWAWFIPQGIAYPTLSHIEGSHMILKEGIYNMATEDMTSWWPFLCLTVLFYCLLPRFILLITGGFCSKIAISRIDFTQSIFEKLLNRLYNPAVSMTGHPVDDRISDESDSTFSKPATLSQVPSGQDHSTVILIPDDIVASRSQDDFLNSITKMTGNVLRKPIIIDENGENVKRAIAELNQIKADNQTHSIILIQEAWRPPIREDLQFIKELRKALGPTSKIKIGLIGKPNKDKTISAIKEEEWTVWNQKFKAMGDPYLSLERLV